MHAKALTDPLYLVKLEEANRATNGATGQYCEGCHGPIAIMAGELDREERSQVGGEGVTCDLCHQVTGSVPGRIGNTSIAVKADGTRRGQFKDSVSPAHATAYSAFHEKAEFCGNCHDVLHPVNGLLLEATYTEWKNGPYAKEGIVCQDCHMTPGPGVTKPNPGKAAAMGPEREHIYTMTFAGGNVALGDAELAEERLKAAAKVEIEAPEVVAPGEVLEVRTRVTNVGAGHYLPTGLTEVRRMTLQVTARDASGRTLLDGQHVYGTELADAQGNHPVELWDAVAIASDDRIPPRKSSEDTWRITMPEGVVTVEAVLTYRSAPEELAKKAGVEIPTTEMARVTRTIHTSAAEKQAADEASGGSGTSGAGVAIAAAIAVAVLAGGGMTAYALKRRS